MKSASVKLVAFIKTFGPVIVWMTVIFYLSSVPGSGNVNEALTTVTFLERKAAHVSEYFILTLLLARAFRWHAPARNRYVITIVSIAFLYAVSDETHQLFVPFRTGRFTDVLIDGVGILLATGVIWLRYRSREKIVDKS